MSVIGRPAEILVVEDNPGDVRLIQEAFGSGVVRHNLRVVTDMPAALAFLRGLSGPDATPRPDLVLLDLDLHGDDGHIVLHAVKRDKGLASIPVIVFTTSSDERDIFRCYNLHANAYITKPVDLDRYIAAIRAIENFWLTVASLPTELVL